MKLQKKVSTLRPGFSLTECKKPRNHEKIKRNSNEWKKMRNVNRIYFVDMTKLWVEQRESNEFYIAAVIVHEHDMNNDEDIMTEVSCWNSPDVHIPHLYMNNNDHIDVKKQG